MIPANFLDLFNADLQIGYLDVILRLTCALIVGAVIGTEREYTHRPAGMRTHMLVSLGACVVMIMGQIVFTQYQAYGATPDPARMAAQVITGVGFLGAGTIMREGPTVKGLTTAASLWATACLGLAAGGGYYIVAMAGMIFIFVTLTIFETIQKKLVGTQRTSEEFKLVTNDISACLSIINAEAAAANASVNNIQAQTNAADNTYSISFRMDFTGSKASKRKQTFFENLACASSTVSIVTVGEFVGNKK